MITRITKDNADLYSALFARAVEALQTHDEEGKLTSESGLDAVIKTEYIYKQIDNVTKEDFLYKDFYLKISDEQYDPVDIDDYNESKTYYERIPSGESITTLDEYFLYIDNLKKINSNFTVLPVDGKDGEEYFKIDANARSITIPDNFQKHGVSVQGDEIAEVLYFKINRYFDAEDLKEKNVFIQWKAPAGKDGVRLEGVSHPWVYDATIEPGYIIFGWPLSSVLTKNPGQIDFAVRFYSYNKDKEKGKKIEYSLSTLTSKIVVKETLNFDIEAIMDDQSNLIIDDASILLNNRIVNSSAIDGSTPDPLSPESLILKNKFENIKASEESQDKSYYNVYLTDPATGENFEDAYYYVQGVSSDGGAISYSWSKRNESGNVDSSYTEFEDFYTPTDDAEMQGNKIYYIKETVEEGKEVYKVWTGTDNNDFISDKKNLYERLSRGKLNLLKAGEEGAIYRPRINNRLNRKYAYLYPPAVRISGPSMSPIIGEFATNGIILKDEEGNITPYELTIPTITGDTHAYTTHTLLKKGFKENDYINAEKVDKTESELAYIITEPGYYSFGATSQLNGREVTDNPEERGKVRVTYPAGELIPDGINYDTVERVNTDSKIEVLYNRNEAEKDIFVEEDSITYQWYLYNGEVEEFDSKNVDQIKQVSTLLEGETQSSYSVWELNGVKDLDVTGVQTFYFFCVYTNTFNNDKFEGASELFTVKA